MRSFFLRPMNFSRFFDMPNFKLGYREVDICIFLVSEGIFPLFLSQLIALFIKHWCTISVIIKGFVPGSKFSLAEVRTPACESFNCYFWFLHWKMLSLSEIKQKSLIVFTITFVCVIIPLSFSVSTDAWPMFDLKEWERRPFPSASFMIVFEHPAVYWPTI